MMSFLRSIIPPSVLQWYHYALSMVAAVLFNSPSKEMTIIGVTGTNGKSTVVELIRSIFESAGLNAASLSSIRSVINGEEAVNMRKMTMPGRFALQRFLRDARSHGISHVVLEATSEGIRQFRHRGIDWDGLVLTNLAPEHIESHGSFEAYKQAKETLFAYLAATERKGRTKKIIVVNVDDGNAKDFLKYDADEKWGYATSKASASRMQSLLHTKALDDLGAEDSALLAPSSFEVTQDGISLVVSGVEITSQLKGNFNVYNILAAVALARAYGIEWRAVQRGIEKMDVIPGRLEYIQKEPFAVVVDYAHTPDALENVYKTLKPPQAQMICVLGAAGGGRDRWKRPEFGKIASTFCNEIILTNEDPYEENPSQILSEIESGISNFSARGGAASGRQLIFKILDRAEAIKKAVGDAKPGDVVILTGKGSEQWIAGNNVMIPWDEREIARKTLLQK
ncbi:MAG: UDP-N-acetylmuramoyl-L-alanyl-D-glutamate--2,6-diaminopimelate ligase [bacterium]|nr:UDP-N-acetylmuramoyl-L-alanyl-D-glutamate--2,6-diaminopimelate ligase [bacterium]